MTADGMFILLAGVRCGAYAMSIDQTIVFWNRAAERILGHRAHEVLGRRCYEVFEGQSPGGFTPECVHGCPSIRYLRAGMVPTPLRLNMLCASGERRWVTLTPMVVTGILRDAPILVHLFEEVDDDDPRERIGLSLPEALAAAGAEVLTDRLRPARDADLEHSLTPRELEVLQLIAVGRETPLIAQELGISAHTVRKHISNLRQKLGAATKLDAVLAGMRLGILPAGTGRRITANDGSDA